MAPPNAYEVLGRHIVGQYEAAALEELLGDVASTPGGSGFNWGTLINAAAEAANQGVAYDASKKAAAAAAASSNKSAATSIAADAAWASAEQQLNLNPSSSPAQALQSQAQATAMAAGMGLPADAVKQRVAAAQKAAQDAAQQALQATGDGAKQAMSKAWQKVLTVVMATGGAAATGAGGSALAHLKGGESWFTAKHAGLPGWAWVATGVTVPTLLVLIVRALRK